MSRNRLNLITAIYMAGRDYHSGQWSRGYRLCCRAAAYLERHGYHIRAINGWDVDGVAVVSLVNNIIGKHGATL